MALKPLYRIYLILKTRLYWRASVASKTLNTIENRGCLFIYYWRASKASESVLEVDNAKLGICYICMYVWMVRMLFKRARGELFSPNNTVI